MWKCVALVASAALTSCGWADTAASLPAPKPYPVEAELIGSLHAERVKPGDKVLVKLDREWVSGSCRLPLGHVLAGHVLSAAPRSRTSKTSKIALAFDADCAPVQPLALIALLAPDDENLADLHDGHPVTVQALRSSSFGESSTLGPAPVSQGNYRDLSNRQAPNLPLFTSPTEYKPHPRPTAVATGQVWHIPGVSLSVASGPEASSVLSSEKKELRLATRSVFILSPMAAAPAAVPASKAPVPAPTLPASARPPDETEICAAGSCSVALPAGDVLPTTAIARKFSLAGLGYVPRNQVELLALDHDAAVAYLSQSELLFTFNPHALVSRTSENTEPGRSRIIRAVLINLSTSKVERTVEWRVADAKRYLWPLGSRGVLVHVGGQLRLYGPGLQEQARIELHGPLAFVQNSPDQHHFAVGVVRELHSGEMHRAIAEATSGEPEEQVDIQLLDEKLQRTGTAAQSSRALPPVLSNAGEIVLTRSGKDRWRYKETSWSGATRTVVRISSSCMPEMSSIGPHLLYMAGCDTRTVDRWYRVLRDDGRPVLKGTSLLRDLDPVAVASRSGDAFAVTLARGDEHFVAGEPFRGNNLVAEAVRVYRASDGQRVFAANLSSPAPSEQVVAFAPDGEQLAVVDGRQIAIYRLTQSSE